MASNAERLREMYERFWKHGDVNAGRDIMAREIEWNGLDEADLGGQRHGGREVSEFFVEWLEAWEDYENDVEVEEVTPDVLVARSRFRGRGKGSGIEFDTEFGQVWEFQGGKAVRQTMYRTYEEARKAADLLV
jgi:ketosteroid isomerase-like protein